MADNVVYGTEENPFQVHMPGWDDFIHLTPPPETTKFEFFTFINNDEEKGRRILGDRKWEHFQKRLEIKKRIEASPLPDPAQALRKVVIALDEAQDYANTVALTGAGLSFFSPAVGLPIAGAGALASGLLGLVTAVLSPTGKAQRKRIILGERKRDKRGRRRLKHRGADFVKNLNPAAATLAATQASYTIFGVGTTIGSAIIFAEDTVWGTVAAARGKHVEIPLTGEEGLSAFAAKSLINSFWGMLAGDILTMDDHYLLAWAVAAANLQLAEEAKGKDLAGRILEAQDWALPFTRMRKESSRAMLEYFGIDPDGPQAWPVEGHPEILTLNQMIELGTPAYEANARELEQRAGDDPRLHFLQTMEMHAAETTLAAVTGDVEPYDLVPEDDASFALGMAELLPIQERLHPAATLRAVCRQYDWWQAHRPAFETRAVGSQRPERGAAVVHQGWREAFVPEIVAAGGAPKFWARAGPPTSCSTETSTLEARRGPSTEFGAATLEIITRGDSELLARVPPDRERALDRLTDREIFDNLSADPTGQSLPLISDAEASRVPVGDGAYKPFGLFDPLPEEDITPPSREWKPAITGEMQGYVLTDFNFAVYGATHKQGWQQGGPLNVPITDVAWPSRYVATRDMFEVQSVGPVSTQTATPAPNQVMFRPAAYQLPAEDTPGTVFTYDVIPAETVALRTMPGWGWLEILRGPTEDQASQDLAGDIWRAGYRPQPWLAITGWDTALDAHVGQSRVPWVNDYVQTMAAWVALNAAGFFGFAQMFEFAVPACASAWTAWHDLVRSTEDPIPVLPEGIAILPTLGLD